jgi:hypothetical protein
MTVPLEALERRIKRAERDTEDAALQTSGC